MEQLRFFISVFCAKLISFLTTIIGKGGGTAAPGYYALKIDPKLVRKLAFKIEKGTIIVAGTNGKTTTSRMISTILKESNISHVHNSEGSNLLRGIVSSLLKAYRPGQHFIAEYAVLEVDEATLPPLLHEITPKVIVLTNLFRDQLDRYGEVNTIRNLWRHSLEQLGPETTVILNADDPSIAHLGHNLQAKVVYYGLDHLSQQVNVSGSADANYCAVCQNPLSYNAIYFSHVGKYKCNKCGFTRPNPEVEVRNIETTASKTTATVQNGVGEFGIEVNLPGLYNVYNSTAATSAALALDVKPNTIITALKKFTAVFGRVEILKIKNKIIKLYLVKNPTGYNEVIHTLAISHQSSDISFLLGLNDNFADGRDISWIWDVDFEKLVLHTKNITATGIRAYDLGVRLKYAGLDTPAIEEDCKKSIEAFLKSDKSELVVLPTYTIMLDMRKYFVSKGYLKHYLKEGGN